MSWIFRFRECRESSTSRTRAPTNLLRDGDGRSEVSVLPPGLPRRMCVRREKQSGAGCSLKGPDPRLRHKCSKRGPLQLGTPKVGVFSSLGFSRGRPRPFLAERSLRRGRRGRERTWPLVHLYRTLTSKDDESRWRSVRSTLLVLRPQLRRSRTFGVSAHVLLQDVSTPFLVSSYWQ